MKYKKEILNNTKGYLDFQRLATLKAIDETWVDQVDNLQQLKGIVTGRQTAQKNPLYEYYNEALDSYDKMRSLIKERIIRNILLSDIRIEKNGEVTILFP